MKRILPLLALLAGQAFAGNYIGEYAPGDTVDCNFSTYRPSTGATFTLGGTPAVSAYKDNSATQSTAGITLSADFDSVTGLNHVRVTTGTDGTFYSAGSYFSLVITTGTVDSVSVTGSEVCSFSLNKEAGLRPGTAGRTITVDASGNGNANLVNIAGSAVSASTAQLGVNVVNFGGSAGTFASGRPEVNVTHWTGSSLTTGTGPLPGLGVLDRGDLQADSTTTMQLRSAATFANDELNGATGLLYSATTGAGQRCLFSDYVSGTDTATCAAAMPTDPTGTVRYEVYGTASAVSSGSGATAQEVWEYGTRTLTSGGDATEAKQDTILANLAIVDGNVDDIETATSGIPTFLTDAGTNGAGFTALPWNSAWDAEVQSEATDALNAYDPPTRAELTSDIDGVPTAAENAAATIAAQGQITGTCDSGSTTTCVDDALTQADATILQGRLMCFSDGWCGLITTFAPSTDTATTTKVAPSTRASKTYSIFPATLE
jgi:hypothetical protein